MMIVLAHALGFVLIAALLRRYVTSTKQRTADRAYASRYFNGFFDPHAPHPCFAATGTEGRCELCGGEDADPRHLADRPRGLWCVACRAYHLDAALVEAHRGWQ